MMARETNVGIVTRVPHDGGVLDETLKPGMEGALEDHRALRRRDWFKWAYTVYEVIKPLLNGIPGTPGQKALRFILDSINPHSIVLIAIDPWRLEEYVGTLNLPALDGGHVEVIMRIHDDMARYNPELQATPLVETH